MTSETLLAANVLILVLEWMLTRPSTGDVTPEQAAKAKADLDAAVERLGNLLKERKVLT